MVLREGGIERKVKQEQKPIPVEGKATNECSCQTAMLSMTGK